MFTDEDLERFKQQLFDAVLDRLHGRNGQVKRGFVRITPLADELNIARSTAVAWLHLNADRLGMNRPDTHGKYGWCIDLKRPG